MSAVRARIATVLACAAVAALGVPAAAAATPDAGSYVVVLADGADAERATESLERRAGFEARARFRTAIKGFAAALTRAQAAQLRASGDVAHVVADIPFTAQALETVARKETVPVGIRRIGAATASHARAASTTAVAVLDTGLDLSNPDLAVAGGVNCITPGATPKDDNGHGTHVAGTLAGRNTGTGVVGVAPGTRLYAVKVLDAKSSGTLSSILCGLDWVAGNARALGIRVANMSVGGAGASDGDCGRRSGDALHAAICRVLAAGVTPVVAAGNSAANVATMVPAAYPEVLTVSGMTDTDGLPGGRGRRACDRGERDDTAWTATNVALTSADAAHMVAAPAACVVSLKPHGGVSTMSGTSMAAPHVAGAVALCVGSAGAPGPCATLTPAEIIRRVRADAAAAAGAGFGFAGDLRAPVAGRLLGDLVSAARY